MSMNGRVRTLLLSILVGLTAACESRASDEIDYRVSLANRAHHEARITMRIEAVETPVLELRMSRTSPGRYALHEFAKNVYDVRAVDGSGNELPISRPDLHQWNISEHDGTVVFSYTIFGDRSDGTYMAVDDTHAHLNAPATFVWARGLEDRSIRVRFADTPPSWKVATQLDSQDGELFTAANLAYFLDSPIEVSDFTLLEWSVPSSRGEEQRIRLAIHHQGTNEQAKEFQALAEAVVREQIEVFGEVPEFDYGTYTFIADYLPWVSGDGMEHRNSTILSSQRSLEDPLSVVGTLSHEFFHAWNVERIRPRNLEPFDFENADVSTELWFAEGFTSYYDDLTLRRAGVFSLERFAEALEGTLDSVINAPGRRFYSPMEMSRRAPFVDAARSVDPQNRRNTFVSYYSYGAVLGLALDLEIRSRYPGKSLDDMMRLMWERHGKTESPYVVDDLERSLADAVGDAAFAREFFEASIHGSELPDLKALLAKAGFVLRAKEPEGVWLGVRFREGTLELSDVSVFDSPAYRAGLDRGDRIRTLNNVEISNLDELREEMSKYEPGQRVPITFEERSGTSSTTLEWQANPALELIPFEAAGETLSDEVRDFRSNWLAPRRSP